MKLGEGSYFLVQKMQSLPNFKGIRENKCGKMYLCEEKIHKFWLL